jgi:RNA polymerase sigma-70 factor, ECF subfamily
VTAVAIPCPEPIRSYAPRSAAASAEITIGSAALSAWHALRRRLAAFMHFMSPPEEGRYTEAPSDRWVLPAGLGPDEMAAELTSQFWDRLRFFAMRRLRDAALAEDVAQETLRRTLEALRAGRIEKPESLPAFLFETARHVCMHRSRSFGREARALQRVAAEGEEDVSEAADPLGGLISDERCAQVRRCLESLEPSDRDVLSLSYDAGLGAEDIGRRLGISAGAVRVRRHRALARLAEMMGVTRSRKREQD